LDSTRKATIYQQQQQMARQVQLQLSEQHQQRNQFLLKQASRTTTSSLESSLQWISRQNGLRSRSAIVNRNVDRSLVTFDRPTGDWPIALLGESDCPDRKRLESLLEQAQSESPLDSQQKNEATGSIENLHKSLRESAHRLYSVDYHAARSYLARLAQKLNVKLQ
jgi:hypothetical protein